MESAEQLIKVEETLASLRIEHKKILGELDLLQKIIPEDGSFSTTALSILRNFKQLMLVEHHQKEDNQLLQWMLNQNKTVDSDIIGRIRREHDMLEAQVVSIDQQVEKISPDSVPLEVRKLAHDLSNFIDLYREHVDLEEKFIFLIAKGLLSARKREHSHCDS